MAMSDPKENTPEANDQEESVQPEARAGADQPLTTATSAKAAAPSKDDPPKNPAAPLPTERDLSRMSRRELLKLTPVVLLGAFAVPKFQNKLLENGVTFSD